MRSADWSLYFLLKMVLFWSGAIQLHLGLNALLLGAIAAFSRFRRGRTISYGTLIIFALALLYHESWLPEPDALLAKLDQVMHFDRAYLLELASRVVEFRLLLWGLAAWVVYYFASWYIRTEIIVLAAFVVSVAAGQFQSQSVAVALQTTTVTKEQALEDFFTSEKNRRVNFTRHQPAVAYPDIVFLHVCSLSWDDLKASGLDGHPLWRKFDFLFTRFNSVSTYSGPAVIRLLRGGCGQQSAEALYDPANSQCLLFSKLEQAGYKTSLAMNHDGHFDDFIPAIERNGLKAEPRSLNGLRQIQDSFDGSPIFDDLQALKRWSSGRGRRSDGPEALFYNSISLHDGNVVRSRQNFPTPLDSYRYRAKRMLDDILQFIAELEAAQRPTILVLVPEHGAAVRGDALQFSGLREIPSPSITLVPVGVKLVGAQGWGDRTALIDREASYLDLTQLVSRLHDVDPADIGALSPEAFLGDLSSTPFVAENESVTMVKEGDIFYWKRKGADWFKYACVDRCNGGTQ